MAKTEAAKAETGGSSRRGRGQARGRGRGGGGRGRGNPTVEPPVEAPGVQTRQRTAAIVINSDDDPDSDDDPEMLSSSMSSDSSVMEDSMAYLSDASSVEGLEGAYYGGYGECYRCGKCI